MHDHLVKCTAEKMNIFRLVTANCDLLPWLRTWRARANCFRLYQITSSKINYFKSYCPVGGAYT